MQPWAFLFVVVVDDVLVVDVVPCSCYFFELSLWKWQRDFLDVSGALAVVATMALLFDVSVGLIFPCVDDVMKTFAPLVLSCMAWMTSWDLFPCRDEQHGVATQTFVSFAVVAFVVLEIQKFFVSTNVWVVDPFVGSIGWVFEKVVVTLVGQTAGIVPCHLAPNIPVLVSSPPGAQQRFLHRMRMTSSNLRTEGK